LIYDLIIIGGGPAGYHAAELAGKNGAGVLLAEKGNIGGVCLNEGCIPTKTLLYSAKLFEGAVNGEKYGVTVANAVLDHETVLMRKSKVVRTLAAGVKARLRDSGVVLVEGMAVVNGKKSDGSRRTIFDISVGDSTYNAYHLLLAAGSEPVVPAIPGIKEGIEAGYVLTSREILDLKKIPDSLVIIGAGAVGLEMAYYFNAAGSKVTVIEMLDHIAGPADGEIAAILLKNLSKKGIDFRLNSRVTEIRENGAAYSSADSSGFAAADKVLLSIGRKPALAGLGLESIGIATENGRIPTDSHGQTNVSGVYAAGDVNGVSMLAHTAYREAEVCINNIFGREDTISYSAIPTVIYTNPEAAGVGETEESARAKGIGYDLVRLPMRYSGRYMAENEAGDGICKILTDKSSKAVIGIHMIGNHSSEIIYGAAMMTEKGMRASDLKNIVFPHPTVSEIIKEALAELEG